MKVDDKMVLEMFQIIDRIKCAQFGPVIERVALKREVQPTILTFINARCPKKLAPARTRIVIELSLLY